MNDIFDTIFETTSSVSIGVQDFLLALLTAIIIGVAIAFVYSKLSKSTKSFIVTLATIPLVVCMVIIMVNGNIGAGVAVAGAFSLVRFRSIPGSAREISAIFLAMSAGLTVGMGYLMFAIIFSAIACLLSFVLNVFRFCEEGKNARLLKVTIPENLNHTDIFDDVLSKYAKKAELVAVKTVSMGSLFKLSYEIELFDIKQEKEFMDELRCKNGNLEIMISRNDMQNSSL